MSEKRKPAWSLLIKRQGGKKTNKVELFDATLWNDGPPDRYRLRVNGKWWPEHKREYFTKTHVKELVFKAMK